MTTSLAVRQPEERHGQGTRPGACFKHPRAWIDIGPHRDESQIFGIQHLCASRHFQDIIPEGRTHGQHRLTARKRHDRTIQLIDESVVRNFVTAQLIEIAGFERQGVVAALRIDEMNAFAVLNRACDMRAILEAEQRLFNNSADGRPGPFASRCIAHRVTC